MCLRLINKELLKLANETLNGLYSDYMSWQGIEPEFILKFIEGMQKIITGEINTEVDFEEFMNTYIKK